MEMGEGGVLRLFDQSLTTRRGALKRTLRLSLSFTVNLF